MAYIEGKQRGQHTLFPTTLDELIAQDHACRVIEAFGRSQPRWLGNDLDIPIALALQAPHLHVPDLTKLDTLVRMCQWDLFDPCTGFATTL